MKKFLILALALGVSGAVTAQNIKQSVEVTNDYETRFTDFRKSGPQISLPDTLYRFDYSFDYSLFDTPYKGAYEFSPYEISMTPAPVPYDGSKLYLRTGAGYKLHPMLDFAFSALAKDNFALSVFNSGRGFFGGFYDAEEHLGLSGHYLMKRAAVTFQTGYDGVFAGISGDPRLYHSAYVRGRITSGLRSAVPYQAEVEYRYGTGQQDFSVKGFVAPGLSRLFDIRVDFGYGLAARQGGSVTNLISARPYAQFRFGKVDLDAGAVVDLAIAPVNKSFAVAPFARASVLLGSGGASVYAGVDGGQYLPSGLDLRMVNPFMNAPSGEARVSREKLNAHIGINALAGKHLQVDIKGGYVMHKNAYLAYVNDIGLADYNAAYAELSFAWNTERLVADGHLNYKKSLFKGDAFVYEDAPLKGDLRVTYNWSKRIYAGVSVEGASSRKDISGMYAAIPWYVSPGIYAEYKLNGHVGLWMKAANLAFMDIYRFPGYAETNPHITAGVCLKF